MRTLLFALVVSTSTSAVAGDPTTVTTTTTAPTTATTEYRKCAFPMCGGIQAAIEDALAEDGLTTLDGYGTRTDASGQHWLTVVSEDAAALDAIAPRSGARTESVKGTTSFVRTIPMALTDITTITTPGLKAQVDVFLEIDQVGGESGGTTGCYEVCECNSNGMECWVECP